MSPDRFGSYRLVEKIGRGSAGTVFVGEYGSLRRPIAIKVLHEHLVADGSAARMLAEARALCRLDHPGIVKVLDCGTADDGRAYIVMERLAGELLHQRLCRGPLGDGRVVMFSRQLASALEVAHAAGVIHRDVKPENIFIVPDPDVSGGERVKLIDFGIAKCGDQEQTETGVVLGTPAYMAPEQFAARRRIDHRADIYALGVVMYAMATGTLPFAGNDTEELRAEHSFCLPTPASVVGVSARLSAIIERCLAKQPEDRFTSTAQLGAALRELELDGDHARGDAAGLIGAALDELETRPVSAVPSDHDVRRRMPWRRALGAVAILTVALLSVQLERDDVEDSRPAPAHGVVGEASVRTEEPALEIRSLAAPPATPAVKARREPPANEVNAEQPRRESPRVRPRPRRPEPSRTESRPGRARHVEVERAAAPAGPPAPTKEDYASVSPPTLY